MNGGVVNISGCESDCIDSDDYGCVKIKGGTLTLNVSSVDGSGVLCDSIYHQSGGAIHLNVTGQEAKGIRTAYSATFKGGTVDGTLTGNGTRGIRGKKVTKLTGTVRNGGALVFSGADINLTASGGAQLTTLCAGIYTDTTITQTAGDITVNVTKDGALDISAATDNWQGGTRNGAEK